MIEPRTVNPTPNADPELLGPRTPPPIARERRISAGERRRGFDNICAAFCHLREPAGEGAAEAANADLGVLVALARSGSPLVTAGDLRWRDTAEQSCRSYGVALLGVWLVTPEVIRPLPPGVAARRSA